MWDPRRPTRPTLDRRSTVGQRMRSSAWLVAIGLVVVACTSAGAPTVAPTRPPDPPVIGPTSIPARFDLAAVQAAFTTKCKDTSFVELCQQVSITGMSADGTTLRVPATSPVTAQRAGAICSQLAQAHFDAAGKALGYEEVAILDKDGRDTATCAVF